MHPLAGRALAALLPVLPVAAQSHLFTLEHPTNIDLFGSTVALAGDVDGDGHADVLVGARGEDTGGAQAGAARIYSGRLGLLLATFHGQAGHELGSSLAAAGDVDGDGLDDVAIGAWHAGPGPNGSGRVRIRSGADGAILRTIPGPGPSSGFAWSMAPAGDVDGDGFEDLVVGAYLDDRPGLGSFDNAGSARVYSGADGSELLAVFGSAAGESMGLSVAGVGDLDGDGLAEIAAGSRGIGGTGFVRVFRGADGALLHDLPGTLPGQEHGFAVAGLGDVDGDGVGDLVVGGPAILASSALPGSAFVYSGADGSLLYELEGPQPGSRFGRHVAGIGDVDGDGRGDLAVGAELADSPTMANTGAVFVHSGADGSLLFVRHGETGNAMGYGLAGDARGGGDVNGDGTPDLVVGAPNTATAVAGPARALVLSGTELLLSSDRHLLSSSAGGSATLDLRGGPDLAGRAYRVLGTFSGTAPGTVFLGAHLPLNRDRYFDYTLRVPGERLLVGSSGTLDATGAAQASLVLWPGHLPALVGLTLHHACLVQGPAGVLAVSTPVPLTVLP